MAVRLKAALRTMLSALISDPTRTGQISAMDVRDQLGDHIDSLLSWPGHPGDGFKHRGRPVDAGGDPAERGYVGRHADADDLPDAQVRHVDRRDAGGRRADH